MLTTTSTFAALKRTSWRFIVGEYDGRRWATNSYWLIDIDRKHGKIRSPLAELVDDMNIAGTAVCEITRHSIRVQPGLDLPDFATIIDKLNDDQPIERLALGGLPVILDAHKAAEMWIGADGTAYLIDRALREFVDGVSAEPKASWRATPGDPLRPLARRAADGTLTAVLMPIRPAEGVASGEDIAMLTAAFEGLLAA